jgi:peptidyl-prolyl cis-trans isomerase C
MQPGQVAGPVQTQFGWHLIKLEETRPATPPTLEDLTPEITQELQRKAIDDYVASLSKGATITRTDGIDPAIVRDQTLLGN